MIQGGSQDTYPVIVQIVPVFLERLQKTFTMPILSTDDKEEQAELQSLLCSGLQVVSQKLEGKIKPYADKMMALYLQVFNYKNATVHEEALMAVGALANAVDVDFEKYMSHFRQHLNVGLRNVDEYQVCTVAVGVVGDICRAINDKILPYCDEFVSFLLQDLQNANLNREVQPIILSTFGDIALAIGGNFEKYLMIVMHMLQKAGSTEVSQSDYDLVDYLNNLREGIFEAYTGIIQGLRSDNKSPLIEAYAESIILLIESVAKDDNITDALKKGSVGVLGDLAHSVGPKIKLHLLKESIRNFVASCIADEDPAIREVAKWTKQVIDLVVKS